MHVLILLLLYSFNINNHKYILICDNKIYIYKELLKKYNSLYKKVFDLTIGLSTD